VDNFTISLDYLASSVVADPQEFGTRLASFLGGEVTLARPRNGYTFGYAVQIGDQVVAEFHLREGDPIWSFAPGARSQDLLDFLASSSYSWEVTRMDAALDCYDAEWFGVLVDVAKRWAETTGLTTGVAGDWINPRRGRTFYLGSRSSRFFHRIYEKGRQLRTDPNWIRCELEYKPQAKEDRLSATRVTAAQLWSMHAGPIFGQALGVDLARVWELPVLDADARALRVRRDVDRARRSLAAQYGKCISRWLQECGGDPVVFVAEIMTAIEHQQSVRRWQRAEAIMLPNLGDVR